MKKIKFLFDLGNVFFDWDPRYFYKDVFDDSDKMEYFLNNICNDEWNFKQDSGRLIKDGELELISQFPDFEAQIKMYYSNHKKMIRKYFKLSVELLNFLFVKGYESYVLSNWSSETFIGMKEEYPFLKQFKGMIISGEEKLCKPDPAIYKLAISRFNLDPQQTVFVDDKYENILAAKKLGFQTIHLKNPDKIKSMVLEKI